MWTEFGFLVWLVNLPHLMSSPLQLPRCREGRVCWQGGGGGCYSPILCFHRHAFKNKNTKYRNTESPESGKWKKIKINIQKASLRIRGPFLERLGNFSCSKSDLKIKTSLQCRHFLQVHECFCLQKCHLKLTWKESRCSLWLITMSLSIINNFCWSVFWCFLGFGPFGTHEVNTSWLAVQVC